MAISEQAAQRSLQLAKEPIGNHKQLNGKERKTFDPVKYILGEKEKQKRWRYEMQEKKKPKIPVNIELIRRDMTPTPTHSNQMVSPTFNNTFKLAAQASTGNLHKNSSSRSKQVINPEVPPSKQPSHRRFEQNVTLGCQPYQEKIKRPVTVEGLKSYKFGFGQTVSNKALADDLSYKFGFG